MVVDDDFICDDQDETLEVYCDEVEKDLHVRCYAEWFGSAVSSEFQSCSGVLRSFGSALLLSLGLPSCSAGLCLALRSLVSAGREELCS
ncbi:hypothetical protein MRB53_028528 [Persea americana]|uniref:Uncharacterized protein n=1 Tax=Persea americana TaxID=3435 RepID=A0ACC2KFT1_PERAE|nr:hypothetical protein MRB53_028528 [Persea americana]